MRCPQCCIDLGESVRVCPLCGAEAVDDPAALPELHEAPYPAYSNVTPLKVRAKKPHPGWLRAGLIIAALSVLLGQSNLWTVVTPFCLVAVAVGYFCYGFKEKGDLMHSAVTLVTSLAFQLLFFLHALLHHMSLAQILLSMTVTAVFLAILYLKFPERVEAQMEATFHL
ncbi:MAG: hypothetical protein II804_02235 [Clostridia bacterium]|nr:hypothetical protein [Clostridia bacterium]